MAGILERLYRIARTYAPDARESLEKWLSEKEADIRARKASGRRRSGPQRPESEFDNHRETSQSSANPFPGVPQQVVDDLEVFGLTPPSSMAEVKKARNREIKKFHSDRFMNDAGKFDTSKQIMQIYNAAYDRLEAYYESQTK